MWLVAWLIPQAILLTRLQSADARDCIYANDYPIPWIYPLPPPPLLPCKVLRAHMARNSSTIEPAVSFPAVVVHLGLSSGMTLVAILLLMLSGSGVVFMAATNRADLLDNALTRPGRFDWRVFISKPDQEGREAILKASQPHTDLQPMSLPIMQLHCCRQLVCVSSEYCMHTHSCPAVKC